MRFDTKKYISMFSSLFTMNPILNVRLPEELQNSVVAYSSKDGYANLQDLVRSLLREYYLSKKREELLALWGSQSHVKRLPLKQVREMVYKEFVEKLSKKDSNK